MKSTGTGYPASANLEFVEELYDSFLRDPASVPSEWRDYFSTIANGDQPRQVPRFARPPEAAPVRAETLTQDGIDAATRLHDRVTQLIRNFRLRGHMIAQIDPLGIPRPSPQDLDPAFLGITEADMNRPIRSEILQYDGPLTVRTVLERLRNTYCRSIGVQYMHIDDVTVRRWLQRRMEACENHMDLSRDLQLRILTRLTDAVVFEEFIRKKFVGAKSFSLEGSESLIPLLELAIEKAGRQGAESIVMGMAHRGRLNVLANVLCKSPAMIFREFADADPSRYRGRGDVKYHLGHSSDWTTSEGRKIHLSLCFNPSHLEFVNTVALGRVRAKQDRTGDCERSRCVALLVHGDAAFAGEGSVQETLNLSQLQGYRVGGALHVIVNNQIGFTTAPSEARSSTYAADIGKMLQSPIFLVNGEDPEAVAQAVELAMDFRALFRRDVIIDMYAYRRLGHNEGDDPSFTQPVLYRAIQKRMPVREGYLEHLLKLKGVTREEADRIAQERREQLERDLTRSREDLPDSIDGLHGIWSGFQGGPVSRRESVDSGMDPEKLKALLARSVQVPEGFRLHPKLEKWAAHRMAMTRGEQPLDWASAEWLAMASLASEGRRVRLSGQDSGRGTFSQRHAILYDFENGKPWVPMQPVAPLAEAVEILNSPLSETGVLGFEYGYSLDCPEGLVLWEAQFGDFSNAAQVIIDQFLVSGEDKWNRLSGVVLLLPHGLEGQGPEHSSARLERFLSLAAEDNIQVVQPTTPAQYFHLLRRQALQRWKKPLIVMTPKGLLRHPKAVSSWNEFAPGQRFAPVLPDLETALDSAEGMILCSGRIFYDLHDYRSRAKRNVAIVRLEEIHPFPEDPLKQLLGSLPVDAFVRWVQDEPANMGAWPFLRACFGDRIFGRKWTAVARPASASPATGSMSAHKEEQRELMDRAFQKEKL